MRRVALTVMALELATPAFARCPVASVHPETARLVQMGAGGQPSAKAYEARISAPQVSCASDGSSLKINLTFKVDAALGPNVQATPVKAPYFVAVLYDGMIVAKEIFPVGLGFKPDAPSISLTETVDKISVPLRRNAVPEYEILIGFQLTPEQVRASQN